MNPLVKEKLFSIKKDDVYNYLRKYKEGKVFKEEWRLPESDVTNIQDSMNKCSGITISKREIDEKVQLMQQQKMIA